MKVISANELSCSRGPAEYFTGAVWLDEIVVAPAAKMRSFRVTFEPAARTCWHSHPVGQTLHVLSGIGYVQTKSGELREIRPGDTVWIEPDEVHWHGAAPGHTMVHLATITANEEGVDVVWGELLTIAEYEDATR